MWKNEWNRRAEEISDEIEVVRGGVINDEDMNKYTEQEFLSLVEPKKDEIILDAGCGLGDSIILLADKVKKIYGVDYSEEMVKRAIKRLTKLNKTHNVEICVGDATNLGFQDNYFDKVICMSVFQYLKDEGAIKTLEELLRVTKPNGCILLHVKNSFSLYGLVRFLTIRAGKILRKLKLYNKSKPLQDIYRPFLFYKRIINGCGGKVIEDKSFGLWAPYFPMSVIKSIAKIERVLRKSFLSKILVNIGVDYKIKVLK